MFSSSRSRSRRAACRRSAKQARLAVERLEPLTMLSATIQGTVYDDLDGNGVQDVGDPGLAGVTVYLDQNANGTLDVGESSMQTSEGGGYQFAGLAPGNYTVGQILASGSLQTSPAPATGVGALGDVVGMLNVPNSNLWGLAWANGAMYSVDTQSAGNNEVYVVDSITGQLTLAFVTPGEVTDLAFDGVDFWGLDYGARKFYRMSGADGSQIGPAIDWAGGYIRSIAWHNGFLWAAEVNTTAQGMIHKIDATTGQIVASINSPDKVINGLGSDGRSLWATSYYSLDGWARMYEIEPATGTVLRSFALPESSYDVAFDGHYLRAVVDYLPAIVQIDIGRPESTPVAVADGQTAGGIDFGNFDMPSAAGQVYEDQDGSGARNAGEPGTAGWRVYVDANGNGAYDLFEKGLYHEICG